MISNLRFNPFRTAQGARSMQNQPTLPITACRNALRHGRMLISAIFTVMGLMSAIGVAAFADGPDDNRADQVRPIPPPGIELDGKTRDQLLVRCKSIRDEWESMLNQKDIPQRQSLTCEVLVFPRAVEMAIEFGQFATRNETQDASNLLDEAFRRMKVVQNGGEWADVVGLSGSNSQRLIVGGYPSKIDGSYQPYGLVVPAGMLPNDRRPRRLDVWFHGRGETLSEVAFLSKQRYSAGENAPSDTFVLHPYGRYCNAFRFAGEVDVHESLDYIESRLPIDSDLISVRGFSMGGAACWQFATHHADRWFAANPGAGFSETPEFLSFFQGEDARVAAPDYQQKLWQLYDCPPWAANLKQCPTVVYSGEIDRQKQAADVMETAMRDVGIDMVHVIGPDTAHKIHPQSKIEIESKMAALARTASAATPQKVEFTTVSLRYHKMHWIDVQGLGEHWKPASVEAEINAASRIRVSTQNVTHLNISFDAGQWPGAASGPIKIEIDGTTIIGPIIRSDRSWYVAMERVGQEWKATSKNDVELRKRPGLQGPIDDALMESFVFVLPSKKSADKEVQQWVETESQHAMTHWRKQFRGDVRQTLDRDLTDQQIASSNLLLFGDPESNEVIARIADRLPAKWTDDAVKLGGQEVPRMGHVPIFVFPNPLNRNRYVVINSGFTYREYDYLNNARQTPKLPDWALVDIHEGPTSRSPGIIKAAGFFDERWQK